MALTAVQPTGYVLHMQNLTKNLYKNADTILHTVEKRGVRVMSLPSGASLPLVPAGIMYFLTGKHRGSIEPLTHTCMCCLPRVMYTDFSI